ncbi:Alpha-1,4-glucan:maltose-1-phosphate maltosyltransferase [Boothiomyces sp. JEL0838]|nr:Alpha-1,4-glucan:maltose-1-phosphate maltosyltransferase [Boothiomyces sp. JEL0838]
MWFVFVASAMAKYDQHTKILLQAFDWDSISNRPSHMQYLTTQVTVWQQAGFTGVWLPPQAQSADPQGYLPSEWYQNIADQSLRQLLNGLSNSNIMPIADVVVNHRCGSSIDPCTGTYTSYQNPPMGNWAITSNDNLCNSNNLNCKSGCGCGKVDTGENNCYAPDLDHSNIKVQGLVIDYLKWLQSLGFAGFRFDEAKGYSGSFVFTFINSTNPLFRVGEYYDGDITKVLRWINETRGTSGAFDFPLYFPLKRSVNSNNYLEMRDVGLISWNSTQATTFVDNHDTARNSPFGDDSATILGNVFILTHPGIPCVFWKHWMNLNIRNTITQLMSIRVKAGVTEGSTYSILRAESGLYVAYISGSNYQLAVKLGSASWKPQSNFTFTSSGLNWQVWLF